MRSEHDPLCHMRGWTCNGKDRPPSDTSCAEDDPLCWVNCTPCDCELIARVRADERAKVADKIEAHLLDDQPLLTYWDGMLDGLHAAARIARSDTPTEGA